MIPSVHHLRRHHQTTSHQVHHLFTKLGRRSARQRSHTGCSSWVRCGSLVACSAHVLVRSLNYSVRTHSALRQTFDDRISIACISRRWSGVHFWTALMYPASSGGVLDGSSLPGGSVAPHVTSTRTIATACSQSSGLNQRGRPVLRLLVVSSSVDEHTHHPRRAPHSVRLSSARSTLLVLLVNIRSRVDEQAHHPRAVLAPILWPSSRSSLVFEPLFIEFRLLTFRSPASTSPRIISSACSPPYTAVAISAVHP